MRRPPQFQWVTSKGGPFVLLPESRQGDWQGSGGPSDTTHYDLARAVNEFVGPVDVEGLRALVFGDEPNDTLVWHCPEFVAVIRMIGAPEPQDLRGILEDVVHPVEQKPELEYVLEEPRALLFDSACTGSEAIESVAVLWMEPGRFNIGTTCLEDDGDAYRLIVHKLWR